MLYALLDYDELGRDPASHCPGDKREAFSCCTRYPSQIQCCNATFRSCPSPSPPADLYPQPPFQTARVCVTARAPARVPCRTNPGGRAEALGSYTKLGRAAHGRPCGPHVAALGLEWCSTHPRDPDELAVTHAKCRRCSRPHFDAYLFTPPRTAARHLPAPFRTLWRPGCGKHGAVPPGPTCHFPAPADLCDLGHSTPHSAFLSLSP